MKSCVLTVVLCDFYFKCFLVLILTPTLFATLSQSYKNYKLNEQKTVSKIQFFDQFFQSLNEASRLSPQLSHKAGSLNNVASIKIDWKNCGSPKDVVIFNNIVLHPNPFQIPGKVSFNFDASVAQKLVAPLQLQMQLKKKVQILGFTSWVAVPCYNDIVGSCTIDNICDLSNSTWCPLQHNGSAASCECPVISGAYNLPTMSQQLPSLPSTINSALVEGIYRGTFVLFEGNRRLACLEVTAEIEF